VRAGLFFWLALLWPNEFQFASGLEAKRLGLLHELVPKTATIAVLVNPNFPDAENQLRDVQTAAARLGLHSAPSVQP